jgi:hypothetical protein
MVVADKGVRTGQVAEDGLVVAAEQVALQTVTLARAQMVA